MNARRCLLTALSLAAVSGCGGGVPVTGTVNLGDKPLAAGTIAFEPETGSGTVGAGAVVDVRDGKFEVGRAKNLTPGKYLVRVSPVAPGSGEDLKTAPPQFKVWETKVEVKSGGEPLTLTVPEK